MLYKYHCKNVLDGYFHPNNIHTYIFQSFCYSNVSINVDTTFFTCVYCSANNALKKSFSMIQVQACILQQTASDCNIYSVQTFSNS